MDIGQYRSDIQDLLKRIQIARASNSTDTIKLCNELENYGREHNDDSLIGFSRFTRGEIYYLLNDMPSFYREMLFCMEPLEKIGEWGYLTMANNMLGIMSLNRGNAPFAMDYYSKALNISQRYRLPDLEWIVHMNLGSMFLSVENFDEALRHYEYSFQYIKAHSDLDNYIQSLTAVCVGFGKAYLKKGDVTHATGFKNRLEQDCIPSLGSEDLLSVYCFLSKYYQKTGEEEKRVEYRDRVLKEFSDRVPIMDIFDDICDFCEMLLENWDEDIFEEFMPKVEAITSKTTVRNLERKLVALRIKSYRMQRNEEECAKAAIRFYELYELMEKENSMMITNMIALRQEFLNLTQANYAVERANKDLEKKSQTDPLTGMYNRARLNEYGDVAFERAMKNGIGIAIEILDIDFFKEYNDNYGHQKGDNAIRYIAASIKRLQRHGKIFAARYGGDEFVIIYESYKYDEVFALARELKQIIVDGAMEHAYSRTQTKLVTISQGLYWGVPEEDDTIWHYLHEADNMLYKVKKKSRNSIALGRPGNGPEGTSTERENMLTMEDADSI